MTYSTTRKNMIVDINDENNKVALYHSRAVVVISLRLVSQFAAAVVANRCLTSLLSH